VLIGDALTTAMKLTLVVGVLALSAVLVDGEWVVAAFGVPALLLLAAALAIRLRGHRGDNGT
jgi:type IV secretory pathway TrbD component